MKNYIILTIAITLLSCTSNKTEKYEETKTPGMANLDIITSEPAKTSINHMEEEIGDTIIHDEDLNRLYENSIFGLVIPFKRTEMINSIRKAFDGYEITKEMGQQDGPDFPLYSVKKGDNEILFFAMDWEDTLKLNEIFIKSPYVIDEYGLKVGDGYQDIKSKRTDSIKTFTNYHQHTYAYTENSNIMYEISGDVYLPDTVDFENLKFNEEQIKDWKIEYIIWRK
ncbi:DUF1131 family protein [Marinigracilibium pacificum]|uniref:DUF1131 family protein n=1 Tax=Marinigracilibium pacificum TaxID=2729599 RepID=A0A848J3I9_9BACT|nr:DUF1131 family protein [Marinigracilibium pacificum]NMM48919.1 DUF1131 family protein [Marinigracilibium pacificum]